MHTHTWNTEYEYERISFNNGKTRVLPVVNGTKWRKAEQHGILSLFPQNKHPIITLAVDHRAVSLLSQVSCLVSNPSLSQFDFKNVGMATSFSRFLLWFWWSSFIFVAVMIQNVPMPWGILAWRSGTMWRGTAWSFTGTRWVHLCRKTKQKILFLVCLYLKQSHRQPELGCCQQHNIHCPVSACLDRPAVHHTTCTPWWLEIGDMFGWIRCNFWDTLMSQTFEKK